MAPKKGKESLLELCNNTLTVGNSIAVHILEYLSDVKSPKFGFRELAVEFLDGSRALFPAKTGLIEAQRTRTQFPADSAEELRELIRQYDVNFTVLKQMVNRLLENDKKNGFSKFGRGFRGMFSDNEIEKMRLSLVQCREAARKNALVFTWTFREGLTDPNTGIGYTALAAVLNRPEPAQTSLPALPAVPASPEGTPTSSRTLTDASYARPSFQPDAQRSHDSARSAPELPPPRLLESPLLGRVDSLQTGQGSSTATTTSHTFSSRSSTMGMRRDDESEMTVPTPNITYVEDLMTSHGLEESMPKSAIRVKSDPTSVPRWRPKRTIGTVSQGSKTALLTAVQEQNHKMLEHLLDSGTPAEGGPECNVLRLAVSNHDLDSLRLLLLFGADANAKDVEGFTPLYAATEVLSFQAAQLLLKYGADANISAGPHGESALAASLTDNRAHFAQLYLKHGADPNATMANGETPLVQAMNKMTPCNVVELLLVYEANPNIKNTHGETALFRAINADRLDLVTLLLDNGADANLPGPKHMLWPSVHKPRTLELLLQRGAQLQKAPGVLELATSTNSIEVVNILLNHNADPNAKKDGIFTPLCTAIRDNHEDLVDTLLAAGGDPNLMASEYPAFKCVTHHRTHILPRLLAAGADPNKPKGIIEMAVSHKNKEALVFLLEHGVDPNARNPAGHTALTTAIRKNDMEAIDTLLAYGADPAVRGQEWPISLAVKSPDILATLLPHIPTSKIPKGALEKSVQADQLESVKSLLAKGVDVEEKNGGVFSPLTTSIREDRKSIFRFLLDEANADPNSPGEHLPIIKAIRRHRENDMSYIKHLLAKGADINLMYRGWNAVLVALDQGDTQTLRLLAELGTPDLNARDEDGNSVLEIMQDRGMKEEERILVGGGTPSPKMREAFSQLREFVRE